MDKQTLKLGARVLENLPQMSSSKAQKWIENPSVLKRFLAGLVSAKICLSDLTQVMISANEINPREFFKTREGLWMSGSFRNIILSRASQRKVSDGGVTIGYADLAQASNDAEIADELPEGYAFENVDTFLVQFAALIESQWGGKSGALLNNKWDNVFYVKEKDEVFATSVYWLASDQDWRIDSYPLSNGQWPTDTRVFSASAA